jgi:hypothetical protein
LAALAGGFIEEALQCIICPASWIFSRRLEHRRLSVNIWEKEKGGISDRRKLSSEIQVK